MDIFLHAWTHLGLVMLLQLLYLEISTVSCFAWHSPNQPRSQSPPAETHLISQRWHQSIPKWYPYTMWKRRKRRQEETNSDLLKDILDSHRPRLAVKRSDTVTKYQKLLDKYNRRKQMNSIFNDDGWKNQGTLSTLGASVKLDKLMTKMTAKEEKHHRQSQYLERKHKSHFGGIGSFGGSSFSAIKDEPVTTGLGEDKKVKASKDSGFGSMGGFGALSTDGFASEPVFTEKGEAGFAGGFAPLDTPPRSPPAVHVADTASDVSTGFGTGSADSGSWGQSSWGSSGSWASDGFGSVGSSSSAQSSAGSWNDAGPTDGFGGAFVADASFSQDTKDCDEILTKSCASDSECSCYGFYTCSANRCTAIQTNTDSSSSGMGGSFHEGSVDVGFSKRKDPTKVIQVFMLPWKPEK